VLLFGVVVATLYPFYYMVNVSLSSNVFVVRNEVTIWPKGFTLEYYRTVLDDPRIYTGYKNTLIYVTVGTFLSLICTGMGGYALSRPMVLRKTFMLMVVFTMLFSGGMIPTFLVVKGVGIMDTMWAMILPGLISVWNLILMRTFFQGLPSEMIDSGKVDGLNDLGVFIRLVLPVSKALLSTIGLFYAVAIWNNFTSALLYLRDSGLFPLQVILRNIVIAGQVNTGQGGAGDDTIISQSLRFATIIVGTLPILAVYPFIQKYFVKGVMVGSVKG
jgi:putative aldouronate transport system permease protein